MKLSEIKKNQKALVVSINAKKELKQRFNSFGINKGSIIKINEYSISNKTIAIEINKSKIALRAQEADKIEVLAC